MQNPLKNDFDVREREELGTAAIHVEGASSLQERQTRTLKHGDTFAVFDPNGDVLSNIGGAEGIYHLDTRHLSHFRLTVDGHTPLLLSSVLRDDNAVLTCDLTNPDLTRGDAVVEHDVVHIRRSRFLWRATCYERIAVRNFEGAALRLSLELEFLADFADLFEIRGAHRERRGRLHPPRITADGVCLAYTGLDSIRRETRLRFHPAPEEISAARASFDLELAPKQSQTIFLEIGCSERDGTTADISRAFGHNLRNARRALRRATSRGAAVATSNETFNEGVRRAISDLYMLITDTDQGPYPYAGIPWFSTAFGRDALITAMETLWLDPEIALGVLRYLAANQAVEEDLAADAEPGKILHEVRYGEMARLGEVPFRRYYGSIDSTPLFVLLAGMYVERTNDLRTARELWPHIEAALAWTTNYGDRDGDGFVEYGRRMSTGLVNQGWKDSHDSIFHADGTLAVGPIALSEVQAYVYGAWRAAANIARRIDRKQFAADCDHKARALRKEFAERFFDEELGTYVLALDGDKRPCRVRSSNAGHVLFTGLAQPEHARHVAHTLMRSSSFSGWGVRTIASTEARYNPMSYHNGSVWPHDNALIAAGLARYGFRREAARIFEGLFAASQYIDLRRLPELFCGFPRQRSQGPTFYPVACSPQAWAATAPLSLVQTCLGLGFDATADCITFNRPVLPSFMDEVVLHRLSVAGGRIDVALKRAGEEVAVHVIRRRGAIRIMTTH